MVADVVAVILIFRDAAGMWEGDSVVGRSFEVDAQRAPTVWPWLLDHHSCCDLLLDYDEECHNPVK